jgi:antitoxin component YwqK of YwqJK toxin-antitoxin module
MQQDTIWNQTDAQGMKQGYWKKFSPQGVLIYKGFFMNDRPVGMMHRFYGNGSKQADLNYIQGTDEIYAMLYHQSGELAAKGKYINMQKDSVWSYFSTSGTSPSYVETYLMGKKNGKSVKYYPEGSISEILNWEDDLKHGEWMQFYEDSTLRRSTSYLNGKLHGEYRIYSPTGVSLVQGAYLNGRMNGTWIFRDNEGNLANRLEYDNGKILNKEAMEEWVNRYMDEVENNLGTIPEVDFENFFTR